MTGNDPITGLLDRIAAYREQVTRLDTREAEHHIARSADSSPRLTGQAASIGRALYDHAAALAQLTATSQAAAESDSYCTGPPLGPWWKPAADGRQGRR